MSEVPLYLKTKCTDLPSLLCGLQGYLANKKTPTPLGPPLDPRHRPTVGSLGGAVSYDRGTPLS